MNDLNWDFKELERAALREGSRNTRRDRSYALRRIGAFLHANFRGLRGPWQSQLDEDDAKTDEWARLKISAELGHSRPQVVALYIGE